MSFYRYTLIGAAIGCIIALASTSLAGLDEVGRSIAAIVAFRQISLEVLAPLVAGIGNAVVLAYLLLEIERA